ncbi:MAG: hypothetical protein O6949_05640, partial [Chloroflexi bacterium]|nr:hypothetical protein [Chloroflexota bacterium]
GMNNCNRRWTRIKMDHHVEGKLSCREVEGACLLLEATFGASVRHRVKGVEIGARKAGNKREPSSVRQEDRFPFAWGKKTTEEIVKSKSRIFK